MRLHEKTNCASRRIYRARQRQADAGLTLVEVLVALVLIGILAGSVALSFGTSENQRIVERTATQMAAHLSAASQQALLTGKPIAFIWDQQSYEFTEKSGKKWQNHSASQLSDKVLISSDLNISANNKAAGRYVVTADLVPASGMPLILKLGWRDSRDGSAPVAIRYDGVNAHVHFAADGVLAAAGRS